MGRLGKRAVVLFAAVSVAGSALLAGHVAGSRRLDRILADANEAVDRRDFWLASDRLDEYLESRPDDLPVRLLAARAARRAGDFDAARKHLHYYRDHQGPSEPGLRELRLLIAQEDGTSDADDLIALCLAPSPPPEVDLVLEVAIEQQLKLVEGAHRSRKTLVEGLYARARSRAERAIAIWLERRPLPADQVQGLVWRGRLNLLTDQRAAVDDFRRATEIDPSHFLARLNLATSLTEYDVGESARHLEYLHDRDPQNEQVLMLLAGARRSLGRPDAAIDLLDELLRRHPTNTAAVLERGKATLDLGRPAEAEGFLRQALAQAPNDPFVHLALSRCLLLLGKESEARLHEQRYQELQLAHLKAEEESAEARRQWQDKADRGGPAPRPVPPGR